MGSGSEQIDDPARLWREALADRGYEHVCQTHRDLRSLRRLPRTWRLILKLTALKPPARCFEVGCGGGIHLVRLALRGFACTGMDVSNEVLQRARRFVESVETLGGKVSSVEILQCDFMKADLSDRASSYDIVLNVGVIEHYLRDEDRIEFLRRKFLLAKPGGFVVSVVPSGMHPYRREQKEQRWGGYNIPEVDYTSEMLIGEMREAGASKVRVHPHNVFGYLLARRQRRSDWLAYVGLQVFVPLLPEAWRHRHGYSFIAVGQKA